ncbi:MAG: TerB family tellurite resistance protein [Candidatus Poseidoniales archaeon]|nr:MAG: TerB family tellurite resistance protein [Candidatus Poseidoniales archaeon]
MFPDDLDNLSDQNRQRYAEILVYIAAADGELVREEIGIIESMMGRAMIHPEARVNLRHGFESPIPLEQSLANIGKKFGRLVLRDAALVAAIDGAYDKNEIEALRAIAKAAGVDEEGLKAILDWVRDGWTWFQEASKILSK